MREEFRGLGRFPMPRLKGYHFPREIVAYAIWVYHRCALGTADAEDLLAARGVVVRRETVRKWVKRFGVLYADCITRDRPGAVGKWHLDEAVPPINGRKYGYAGGRRNQLSAVSYRHARADVFDLWRGYAAEMTA